ncbi:MAG: hypothetical protein CTY39_10300 [Hyphomicrobium sp.]|nr:MAG: hypothetical protein CTY39_10300 [Hyphomicrobium sp.]
MCTAIVWRGPAASASSARTAEVKWDKNASANTSKETGLRDNLKAKFRNREKSHSTMFEVT